VHPPAAACHRERRRVRASVRASAARAIHTPRALLTVL
jgi:hypothetical protein